MVVGALEHRDRKYAAWLVGGPEDGIDHVLHPLVRLDDWLGEVANTGCLLMNALAAYPDSDVIAATVRAHKNQLITEFRARLKHVSTGADAEHLEQAPHLLHERMTQAARLQGPALASLAALRAARAVLASGGIE